MNQQRPFHLRGLALNPGLLNSHSGLVAAGTPGSGTRGTPVPQDNEHSWPGEGELEVLVTGIYSGRNRKCSPCIELRPRMKYGLNSSSPARFAPSRARPRSSGQDGDAAPAWAWKNSSTPN